MLEKRFFVKGILSCISQHSIEFIQSLKALESTFVPNLETAWKFGI